MWHSLYGGQTHSCEYRRNGDNLQFIKAGENPGGTAQVSADHRWATLDGGGDCGWAGPSNTPFNPFNNNVSANNGAILPLSCAP
jgi:hypothetical protein